MRLLPGSIICRDRSIHQPSKPIPENVRNTRMAEMDTSSMTDWLQAWTRPGSNIV